MASLASLLNPSPDSESRRCSPPPSRDSRPSTAMPSEDHSDHSPHSTRSGTQQQLTYPPATAQEAAQALAKLSASPAPAPTQWSGYSEGSQLERQSSWEQRQSGYSDLVQLPPPDVGASRKMSSPTLDQYHVTSRSPEQRRLSIAPPAEHNITLPPIQGFAAPSSDKTRRASYVSSGASGAQPESLPHASHGNQAREISPPQSEPRAGQSEALGRASAAALLPHINSTASSTSAIHEEGASSPAVIKQEAIPTPRPSTPTEARPPDSHTSKTVASLKSEHTRIQSPLRESSVPIPTTEMPPKEDPPAASKKRPAPVRTKKGTASTVKRDKAPPAKKRKVDAKRSETPSSLASKTAIKKGSSAKGTPLNSSPAPSARSYSAEPDEEQYDEEDLDEDMAAGSDTDLYCICRKPDNGTFMIGCDGTCDDWFHGRCVGIEERDKNLIDKYICPSCTKGGIGRTTWKRICRRLGCRQAARTGKTKNGSHGSKYCSEECGVLFFREMVARTRGNEDKQRDRAARRKGSLDASGSQLRQEDDVGARGGALAAGEVKALLNSSNSVDEFRKLGDGVLSPPATPDGRDGKVDAFQLQKLHLIAAEKDEARRRHALLKDRLKFVTLVKQAASRTATEKELKPKEYCGYDSRLEWTEERFQDWRNTKAGQQAIELETLATENSSEKDQAVDHETPQICDRKKCARHLEWSKLAVDDIRFEMGDNGDKMRALDIQEQDIKATAALRAKAGNLNGEGTVEVHGMSIATDKMEVDALKTNEDSNVVETVESAEPMAVDHTV